MTQQENQEPNPADAGQATSDRNPDGTWKAGVSGNPAGQTTPRKITWQSFPKRVEYLIDKYTVKDVMDIVRDPEKMGELSWLDAGIITRLGVAITRDGLKDWEAVIDRLIGKPLNRNEHGGPDGEPIPVNIVGAALTSARNILDEIARRKAVGDGPPAPVAGTGTPDPDNA